MSFDDDFSFSDLQVTDTPRKPPRGRPPREESPLRVPGRAPAERISVTERGGGPGPGAGAKSSAPSKPPPPRAPGGTVLL